MASPTEVKVAEGDTKPSETSPVVETTTSPAMTSPTATSPVASATAPAATGDATTEAALAEAAQDDVANNPSSPVAKTESTEATAGSETTSAAPQTTDTTAASPAAPPAAHADPKVAELQTMFPTVDVGVIEMVLESVGGSQDRAIESLLQMTDPDFKPDELSTAQQEEAGHSQMELDAEFARAMALQDEEEARERERQRRSTRHAQPERTPIPDVLPYQPRVRKPRRPQPDPYAGEHTTAANLQQRYDPKEDHMAHRGDDDVPPGLIAFEEKMNSFAETGRQTFNSFMSRAKAKYAEYQANQAAGAEQRAREQALLEAQPGHAPRSGWGESTVSGGGGIPSRTISVGSQNSSTSSIGDGPAPVHMPSRRWNPSDTFEDPVARPGDRRSPAATGLGASPDKAAAGKIDLAKLGFLPKKRVDLMSTSPQPPEDRDPNPHLPASPTTPTSTKQLVNKIPKTPPVEQSHHTLGDSDDDDDLDYTENPFDRR